MERTRFQRASTFAILSLPKLEELLMELEGQVLGTCLDLYAKDKMISHCICQSVVHDNFYDERFRTG